MVVYYIYINAYEITKNTYIINIYTSIYKSGWLARIFIEKKISKRKRKVQNLLCVFIRDIKICVIAP